MKSNFCTHKRKMSVDTLLNRIKKGSFTFLIEDQVNNQDSATACIGLIISGIDIPVALALEDEMGKYQVVSQGKPLCAIIQFINGEFALSENRLFKEISGKRFNALSPMIINRIYEYTVSISTCLASASTHNEVEELVKLFKAIQ